MNATMWRHRTPACAAALAQEQFYGAGHDYAAGSPHIRHHELRSRIVSTLQGVVGEILDDRGSCRVLEVGAGHGTFTDHLVATGADVVVTEMSGPSAAELGRRFRHNDHVQVWVDGGDRDAATAAGPFDVVVYLSVLHHIPDYLAAVRSSVERLTAGGALVSFQDPLLYARRSRLSILVERGAYLLWRVWRGELRRGLRAVLRRRAGRYDENDVADMVEYHVVRAGVDEQAVYDLLAPRFSDVRVVAYWSAQSGWAQALGRRTGLTTTFGVVARHRVPPQEPSHDRD